MILKEVGDGRRNRRNTNLERGKKIIMALDDLGKLIFKKEIENEKK